MRCGTIRGVKNEKEIMRLNLNYIQRSHKDPAKISKKMYFAAIAGTYPIRARMCLLCIGLNSV